jgi:hypothetical protein
MSRVRRDELYGSGSDGEEAARDQVGDAATKAKLSERLSRMFSLDMEQPELRNGGEADEVLPDAPPAADRQHEPEFEFRLFSTAGPAPRVMVAEKDEHEGDGGIIASRPRSFHLRDGFTEEERERFRQVAVSYSDIVHGARQRAWGLEVPWRVTRIAVSSSTSQDGSKRKINAGEPGKRKRPGKKRRIALRIKEKERKAKEEEEQKHRITKEEHLREKKKRLNREKKLKRRQKEKEKKMAGKSGGEGGQGNDSSSGSDSEGS